MTDAVDVAVDGGQSGVRVRVTGAAEPIIVEGLGRLEGDLGEGLIDRIRGSLAQLPGGVPVVGHMVLGLTTLPASAREREELAERVGMALGAERVWVAGDALTAHAGAFAGAAGVVLTVGTGIACIGFDPRVDRFRLVDGDGFLLGDAGSGFWIGSRGVAAVLRAGDGRAGPTSLTEACRLRFGEEDGLAVRLHSLPRAVASIAAFAVDVQVAARGGDAVARAIVEEAADELACTARAAAAAVSTRPVRIAVSGRLVSPGMPLRVALDARFAQDAEAEIVAAAGDPLDGAWALVSKVVGAAYDHHMTGWRAS
jgi:glucosamine kinase